MKGKLLSKLQVYFEELEIKAIPLDRQKILESLIKYIRSKASQEKTAILNFVCTHNSRRSQISQIMAQISAFYYGIDVVCYSGGTEVTAFHPNAIAAVKRTGTEIQTRGDQNPIHFVRFSELAFPISCFSKTYDDTFNIATDFAAIMTCAHADDNCPVILNAERIPIRYEDPKRADGTEEMSMVYDATVKEIATEMKFVFQRINYE